MPEPVRTISLNGMPGTVAYVLKGFPRLSEIFIASEIYRLEQAGLPLRLFVIKSSDEAVQHDVVSRIRAKPEYLPRAAPVSNISLARWIVAHFRVFLPELLEAAKRRPWGVLRAGLAAHWQAVRSRRSFFSWPRKVYFKEFLQAISLANRLLRASDVRHLHAHFCHGATTVTWLAAMITGLPFSFTAHAKDIYCESLNPAGLLRRKLAAARFVITCTEANRKFLQPLAGNTQVHCVYHGLNAEFTRLLAQTSDRPATNGCLRALAVGRLVPKKGFDTLVEACDTLRRQGVHIEALLVGESGEHEVEIRRRIAERGLEQNIRLTGPMSQSNLLEQYRRATVFCLPCRVLENGDRDGLPNVLMEAMACGLPVVTTGISGIPEMIRDGENGLLVPPDDPKALAGALLRVHRDRDLARRLSQQARRVVRERFNGERLALQLVALFEGAA